MLQGFLIKFIAEHPNGKTPHVLESLIQYKPMLQLYGTGEAVSRLKNIEVNLQKGNFFNLSVYFSAT